MRSGVGSTRHAGARLSLTVIASGPGGAAPKTTRVFDAQDAVIGRGAGCDWILPDPANHLSKRHCIISFSDAGCVVTDTSTNGVYLNDAAEPLGSGNRAPLQDGDRLGIGEYVIEARLVPLARAAEAQASGDDADPFGVAEYRADHNRLPIDRSAFVIKPRQPAAPASPVPPRAGGRGSTLPEDVDFLATGAGKSAAAAPARAPEEWPAAPIPDHAAAERAPFVAPRNEGAAIPENWLDGSGASAARSPVAKPPPETALAAFLAGAGLSPDAVAIEDPARVMRDLGRAYREAVLGLAELLRTRRMVKAEFRIEQTMIGASANNPLKFLSDPHEVLSAMVGQPRPGFKQAPAAFSDGIRDVRAHELAMLSAMQTALTKLIAALDPDTLAARLGNPSLLQTMLPAARKAKCWELFEQSYRQLASELADDFQGTFGDAFAAAYAEEMRRR